MGGVWVAKGRAGCREEVNHPGGPSGAVAAPAGCRETRKESARQRARNSKALKILGRLERKDGPKYCNIMISKIRIQTPVQNILSQYQNIKDMEMQVQYSILNIQYFISICKILSRDGNRESSTLKDVELQAGFTISTTFHNPTWKTRVIPRPSLNKRNGKKSHKNITLLSILP